MVTEEVVAAGAALVFGLIGIRGVTLDVQDHVASKIAYDRIRIGRGVVEERNDLVLGLLVSSSFLRGNGAECNKHGGVDNNGIVQ